MKFVLLVEGKTERESAAEFLKRWLDPQLKQPVGIQPVPFEGYSDLVGKMVTKARMHLEGPRRSEIIGVLGLIDLYGPSFYPQDALTAEDRVTWAAAHFESRVNHPKFRMFFAVHEVEAWLLSQPDIFPREIKHAILGKSEQPERVNFEEPPSKLLQRVYMQKTQRGYKKTTYGKQLFARLDPVVAASKCPSLRRMLDEMLAMCRNAGL